ncbi:hypothetical protein ACFQ0M_00790 [Kitasatospora aburaviensis]
MAVWNDTTVELWDVARPTAPTLVSRVPDQGGGFRIKAVALVAAGPTLLVATQTGISLLDADPANLATRLCSYTTGSLTPRSGSGTHPGPPTGSRARDGEPCFRARSGGRGSGAQAAPTSAGGHRPAEGG